MAWRENRSLTTRLRGAKLKQQASIEDINFRHPRQLDRGLIRSLSSCDWVRERHNIAVSGPSGIGKTFLCCALLEKACREGFTALYFRAEKFFRTLAVAYADGSFDRCFRSSHASTSWRSTIGGLLRWAIVNAGICWKSLKIATRLARP